MADTDSARIGDVRAGFEAVAADALLRLKAEDLMGNAADPGAGLVGYSEGGVGAVLRTLLEKGRDVLHIDDLGGDPTGLTDSTPAFVRASDRGGLVMLGEGLYRSDFGEAGLAGANKSLWLFGKGRTSRMKPWTNTSRGAFGCNSANAGTQIDDLIVTGVAFEGDITTAGHNEAASLLWFSGVNRLLLAHNYFFGPRGDAITVASGFGGGPANERHNSDVVIIHNHFDGLLYGVTGGRNPISIIDCDRFIIHGNTTDRWGRNDMPGGIDLEPDEAYSVIRNGLISGNRMKRSGGNRGHITIAVDKIPHANCENIQIVNNPQLDDAANAAICIYTAAAATTHRHAFQVNGNRMKGSTFALEAPVGQLNGFDFSHNQVHDSAADKGRVIIGDGTDRWTRRDMRFIGNHLEAGATTVQFGITDHSERVTIALNTLSGSTQAHIVAGRQSGGGYGATTYNHWDISGNVFRGNPSNGMVQGDGNTSPETNTFLNNRTPDNKSLLHSFRALRTDNTGVIGQQRNMAALPSTYPVGLSVIKIVSDNGITGDDNGTMFVYNMTGVLNQIHCEFWPVSTGTTDGGYHVRKATTAGTGWNDWVTK